MKIINQRQLYLDTLKTKTRKFWEKVVADYNEGLSAAAIARRYTNPRTGKQYSRQHVHTIINKMRQT